MSTDVLEHLPAALVPLMLAEFSRVATERLFLAIAVTPEVNLFGGVVLHETVEAPLWWRTKFESTGVWSCDPPTPMLRCGGRCSNNHSIWMVCNRTAQVADTHGRALVL